MSKDKSRDLEKPLRMISPEIYNHIISEVKDYNIHSYDLLVNGIKKENGMQIILRFGENFAREQTKLLSLKVLEEKGDELTNFIRSTAETCKKAMIDDYFDKMAP